MASANGKTNWFAIWISAAVVVVLVVLGILVIWLNNRATDPGPRPESSVINAETGAMTFGEGDTTVAVYIDFMCPICNQFEQTYGEALLEAADNDEITLEYHPIAILDYQSTGDSKYSSRSAAAMFSVATYAPDKALDYLAALFENQPAEQSAGLTDEQLIDIAKQVGADAAVESIGEQEFVKFPVAQAKSNKIEGTPTVEVDGERLDLSDQADFKTFTDLLG